MWGGGGTGQWSRLSYSTEVYGWAYPQPAFSAHSPAKEHHRPPIQRSAGPWTCPLVPRCAHLDNTHISLLHLSSVLCKVDVIQYSVILRDFFSCQNLCYIKFPYVKNIHGCSIKFQVCVWIFMPC